MSPDATGAGPVDTEPGPDEPGQPAATAPAWGLVARAQAGDRQAFGELWQRYRRDVYRYLRQRIPNPHTVEDYTSEVFLRAWRRLDSVADRGDGCEFGAWLVVIARNLLLDHHKASRTRLEFLQADIWRDSAESVPSAEEQVLEQLGADQLRDLVAALPSPAQRAVLDLRYWQEMSVAETAAAIGATQPAVKAATHRAILALRQAGAAALAGAR